MKGLFAIALLAAFVTYLNAQTCNSVGALTTFYDPSCAQGGVGCNAGGQTNCRFCG